MSRIVRQIIGEGSFQAHEELLNKALKDVAGVLNRRDVSAVDKLEFIHAHVSKVREELLGKPEK